MQSSPVADSEVAAVDDWSSCALANLLSSSAMRSSRNLMIILSRALFFSEASSAVCFSLLLLVRVEISYSYCFCWMSMFSRFSARSFSTLPTLSLILSSSAPLYLYSLKALGLFWRPPSTEEPPGVFSLVMSSILESLISLPTPRAAAPLWLWNSPEVS